MSTLAFLASITKRTDLSKLDFGWMKGVAVEQTFLIVALLFCATVSFCSIYSIYKDDVVRFLRHGLDDAAGKTVEEVAIEARSVYQDVAAAYKRSFTLFGDEQIKELLLSGPRTLKLKEIEEISNALWPIKEVDTIRSQINQCLTLSTNATIEGALEKQQFISAIDNVLTSLVVGKEVSLNKLKTASNRLVWDGPSLESLTRDILDVERKAMLSVESLVSQLSRYSKAVSSSVFYRRAEYKHIGVGAPLAMMIVAYAHGIGAIFGGFMPSLPIAISRVISLVS